MKKFYVFILIFLLFASVDNAFAQKLSSKYDTSNVKGLPSTFELVSYNWIYNNTATTTTYIWVVKAIDIPATWSIGICDKNNCYFNADSQEFELTRMDSGSFDIHFYPDNNAGTGCVEVYVYPKGSYNEGITIAGCCNGTTGIKQNVSLSFNMYPSPVRDILNIQFSKKGSHSIEIYNILGRRLLTKDVQNADRMRVSFESLQNGMYVVMYRNEKGKVITKTISKE